MAGSSTKYHQCTLQVRIPFVCVCVCVAQQPHLGLGRLTLEISRSHPDTTHRMRDRPVAETSTWHHTKFTTDIHDTGGIRTRNPGKRVATDLRLRSRIGCIPASFVYLLYITLLRPLNAHDLGNLHITQRAYLMFSIIHTHTHTHTHTYTH